ncbi:hypothetical protein [Roseimaritima sediminicola]|uniref:hypothetical protein n=1 Tax=Roseimaritima sediminicola TaxID=2662066 RepID=UPI0012983E4A|nr:hypothetical protein [Roseimaritima sediminicola]
MNSVSDDMPEYLRSPCPEVWQWHEGGDVAVWKDGQTAAFASQLAILMERLMGSIDGMPPLTALLFVIEAAATPGREAKTAVWRQRLERLAGVADQQSSAGILDMLERLAALPAKTREGVDQQAALLTYLLAECDNSLYEASDSSVFAALEWLRMHRSDRPLDSDRLFVDEEVFLKTRNRRTFASLFFMTTRPIDEDLIDLLRRTGRRRLPAPAPVETPPTQSVGDLLRELREDDTLGTLARAALGIAATVSIPRRPQDPDSLPAGGVSDISNRGSPENLLLTELAQEPMALLARIATGQALYLRRESPPSPRPQEQAVLIEAGIRTWGSRREHLASAALGIAVSLDRQEALSVEAFTVAGSQVWPEDFCSREGLIEHLQRLPTDPHPGSAIAQWFEQRGESARETPVAEPILILTANTDRDATFQQSIAHLPRPYLVVRLEPDRVLRLLRRTASGDTTLQRIALPDRKRSGGPGRSSLDRPLYLDVAPSPLRYTYEFGLDWSLAQDNTLWLVSRDGRLLWYPALQHGAVELARGLTHDGVLAHWREVAGVRLLGATAGGEIQTLLVDEKGRLLQRHAIDLKGIDPQQARFGVVHDTIWCFHSPYLSLFDPHTGHLLTRERSAGQWLGTNALLDSNGRLIIKSRSGDTIESHEVANPLGSQLGHVVDTPSRGLVGVAAGLDRWFVATAVSAAEAGSPGIRPTGLAAQSVEGRFVAASSDGRRLVFALPASRDHDAWPQHVAISLVGDPPKLYRRRPVAAVMTDVESHGVTPRYPSVRRRLFGIRAHAKGLMLYRGPQRYALQILPGQNGRHLVLSMCETEDAPVPFQESRAVDTNDSDKGPWLRRAELAGGVAWLDSRGLLHLRRRSDGSELSLVLHDNHLAGWSSTSGVFGGPYFTAQPQPIDVPASVLEWLQRFNRECL